jgi:hypothetical protein
MKTRVTLCGGIDDPHEIEADVRRLNLVDPVSFLTMPDMVARLPLTRLQTAIYHRWLEHAGWYRRSMQHLRYRF